MRQLVSNFKGHRLGLVLGPLFKLSEAVMELFIPLIMANIIDIGIKNGDMPYIFKNGLMMLFIGSAGFLFALICQYYASVVAHGFGKDLRSMLFRHVFDLSAGDTTRIGASTLITRLTNDVTQVQTGINMFIRLAIRAPYLAIGSIIMSIKISPPIGVIFLIATPIVLFVIYIITHICLPYFARVQAGQDNIARLSSENLSGARIIRAFGREDKEYEEFSAEGENLTKLTIRVGKLSALLSPLTAMLVNVGIIAIIYFGAGLVNVGELTSGKIVALVSYMTQTLLALTVLANVLVVFTKAIASARRVAAVLDTKSSMQYESVNKVQTDIHSVLEFDKVSFAYNKADDVVSNISFSIRHGETVGIIGGTGSGKSTLLRLAMRLFDTDTGVIKVDGQDIKSYAKEALRMYFAYVPQFSDIFTGTVRDNITMGVQNVQEADIWQALDCAQAGQFVRHMQNGLDTLLNENGKNLSGGQKQRIALARAMLLKREFLLLDDATSALDYVTDAAVRKAINEHCNGSTVLMVSQRVSSIIGADKILVLDDGELVGFGTHKELLNYCDIYAEICSSQGIGKVMAI